MKENRVTNNDRQPQRASIQIKLLAADAEYDDEQDNGTYNNDLRAQPTAAKSTQLHQKSANGGKIIENYRNNNSTSREQLRQSPQRSLKGIAYGNDNGNNLDNGDDDDNNNNDNDETFHDDSIDYNRKGMKEGGSGAGVGNGVRDRLTVGTTAPQSKRTNPASNTSSPGGNNSSNDNIQRSPLPKAIAMADNYLKKKIDEAAASATASLSSTNAASNNSNGTGIGGNSLVSRLRSINAATSPCTALQSSSSGGPSAVKQSGAPMDKNRFTPQSTISDTTPPLGGSSSTDSVRGSVRGSGSRGVMEEYEYNDREQMWTLQESGDDGNQNDNRHKVAASYTDIESDCCFGEAAENGVDTGVDDSVFIKGNSLDDGWPVEEGGPRSNDHRNRRPRESILMTFDQYAASEGLALHSAYEEAKFTVQQLKSTQKQIIPKLNQLKMKIDMLESAGNTESSAAGILDEQAAVKKQYRKLAKELQSCKDNIAEAQASKQNALATVVQAFDAYAKRMETTKDDHE
jgi:hypothetical protein